MKEKEARLFADDKAKEFTAKHQAWIHESAPLPQGRDETADLPSPAEAGYAKAGRKAKPFRSGKAGPAGPDGMNQGV